MLTQTLVDQFHRDGYLIFESVFSDTEVAALSAEADRMLALALNSSIALGERSPRLRAQVVGDEIESNMLQPVNDLSEVIASVSSDERLIAPMRDIMGVEPVLMEEKLNYKQRLPVRGDLSMFEQRETVYFTDAKAFPLHSDWGYYRVQGYPPETISSAVSIDPTAGRGPIRIIAGSHLQEHEHVVPDDASGDGRVVESSYPEDVRTPVEVPAGSVMLFHSKLLHDSLPNRSGRPRRLMIYSHYPDDGGARDPDRRNGPNRARAQAFEARYRSIDFDEVY